MKKGQFEWTKCATKAVEELKKRMTETPVLKLLDFSKVFQEASGASHVGTGGFLSQEGHRITYFSGKLKETKQKYSTFMTRSSILWFNLFGIGIIMLFTRSCCCILIM